MTALEKIAQLPGWPARMTGPVAAAYMGVSLSTFLTRFGDRGVKEGNNTLWAKAQLDRIIATQFGLAHPAARGKVGEVDDSWDDVA